MFTKTYWEAELFPLDCRDRVSVLALLEKAYNTGREEQAEENYIKISEIVHAYGGRYVTESK
jgi:hypothetical protein